MLCREGEPGLRLAIGAGRLRIHAAVGAAAVHRLRWGCVCGGHGQTQRGQEHRAYDHYMGDTVARDGYPDRIVIYQDTLERDFGHDRGLLRAQVERTVRHELAHHLGWDEDGVAGLGL